MPPISSFTRRRFLSSTGLLFLIASAPGARAAEHSGSLPWKPFAALPPEPLPGGRWYVLTPDEARTIEAIVDRLIPADELSIGGKDAGCAGFIDRQLAGSYGSSDRLYMQGPFAAGLPTQGYQGAETPVARYKAGLAALNRHAQAQVAGKNLFDLAAAEQDQALKDFEVGKVDYKPAAGFFNLVLQNTRVVLQGSQAVATAARPTTPAMPSFGWNLGNAESANVLTYIRNCWGNAAPPVTPGQVRDLRAALKR